LLVVLESSQQARYITENARKLRGSAIQYTRDHIFINPDLTVAESKAAYELRCRRRERREARASAAAGASNVDEGRESSMAVDDVITAVLSDVLSDARSSGDSDRVASTSVTSSELYGGSHLDPGAASLNPTVASFQPSSATGPITDGVAGRLGY
jgi:hypothetical protein